MNKKLGIGIVVVVAIVAMAIFSGCIEKEEAPLPTLTPTPTPSPTPSPTPAQAPEPKFEEDTIIKSYLSTTPVYIRNITNGNYTLSVITIIPFLDEKYILSNPQTEVPIQKIDRTCYQIGTLKELKEAKEVPTKFIMGKYIHIDCDGEWSGSYGSIGSSQSIDGEGSDYIFLTDDYVSAVFQNQEKYGCLEVEVIHDGKVVKSAFTCADYGVVSLSYSF